MPIDKRRSIFVKICGDCNAEIGETKFVKCKKCTNVFHAECRRFTDRNYRQYQRNRDFDCGEHSEADAHTRIEFKLDQITNQLTELSNAQQYLSDKYDELFTKICIQIQ